MKKERILNKTLFDVAFITGIVVTVLLYGGTYWYGEIKNLYLLPFCYIFSMLLVKDYYNDEMGIAVAIIEVTKFLRYIMLPLVYVLSNQFVGYMFVDLRPDYHENAVILMCYEMLAVSLVMKIYYWKNYKRNRNSRVVQIIPHVDFKPTQTVFLFAFLWIAIVLLIGSYRESLLNFTLQEGSQIAQTSAESSNNILDIVFQFGKIYIFSILLYFASTVRQDVKASIMFLASLFLITSSWTEGGLSISRWGIIVSSLLVLYAFYCFYPHKKKVIFSTGAILVFVLIAVSTFFKMTLSWDLGYMDVNEAASGVFATDIFDAYFQGVYSVSNGLSTVDTYGNVIGYKNFLSELFYHFPFAVRILGLQGHTWAEYYFKLGIDDTSKICPSLIQSYFYFGAIGCPIFSCFSSLVALWFSDKFRKECDFTIRLLLVYGIFWLSLFYCINFTIVEAHIWFTIIGIWVCRFGGQKTIRDKYNVVTHIRKKN